LKDDPSIYRKEKDRPFFQHALLKWFRINGLKYPWRKERDPFKLLIAEVMLQRTRAGQVVPVYIDFVKKFPDLQALSSSNEIQLEKFMKRLGLFWRTELLMEMVSKISVEYNGIIPSNKEQLLSLPGIGDYIADALIVFAYGGKGVVVDSNVVRLVSRFFGINYKGEMRRNRDFKNFCQKLAQGISSKDIKKFNWALIDHPGKICTPIPRCQICPLSRKCNYFQNRFNNWNNKLD
jgi:A/G-specific adenine glycosylase